MFFRLLLLSLGFNFLHGRPFFLRVFFLCQSKWELHVGPCSTSAAQRVAAGSRKFPHHRKLPLSDYNLWSISIIGGVCRDSNSNNYLDWSVSKATSPQPPPPLNGEWECVCLCALLDIRTAEDLVIKALLCSELHMRKCAALPLLPKQTDRRRIFPELRLKASL